MADEGSQEAGRSPAVLQEVVRTVELAARPTRSPDHSVEARLFASLSGRLAASPKAVLRELASAALELCSADSSGVSLCREGEEELEWLSAAGLWDPALGSGPPRSLGRSADGADRRRPTLLVRPQRYFPGLHRVEPEIHEALVVPILLDGAPAGALWLLSQSEGRRFDGDDLRLASVLAAFATAASRQHGLAARLAELEAHEEALRTVEERQRLALEAGETGVWELDLRTQDSPVRSPRHDEIFGYSEPLEDWSFRIFLEHVHPEDRSRVSESFDEAFRTGGWEFESRIVRADGVERWIMAKGEFFFEEGTPVRAVGIVRDITDRKRREERVAFLQEMADAFNRLSAPDDIMQAVGTLVGSHLDLTFCLFAEIDQAEDRARFVYHWHAEGVAALPDSVRIGDHLSEEFRRASRAGETFVVRSTRADPRTEAEMHRTLGIGSAISVPFQRNGEWRFLLAVFDSRPRDWRDDEIELVQELANRLFPRLERARAEEALREAKRQAEAASETKSRFLAAMSHELRTPLTSVIGYADLLESEMLGPMLPSQQEKLRRISRSAGHLVAMIDELLTFARTEAGREEALHEPTDLSRLALEVWDLVEPEAEAKGLAMRAVGLDEPIPLRTDPGKVRRIITNLVGNAVRYTEEGGVTLELDGTAEGSVELRVRDTGPGISPDDAERIFEPFTRVGGRGGHGEADGTGLGLAICRRLARLLDGEVTVESTPGEGSTFVLRLPREEDAD